MNKSKKYAKNIGLLVLIAITGLFLLSFFNYQVAQAQAIPVLFKTKDNPAVFYISERIGAKKLIPSRQVFESYGCRWEWIHVVSQETIDQYPDIKLVKTADSPAVFYINGGIKRPIASRQVFDDLGFELGQILTINQTDLDSYQTKAPITSGQINMASEDHSTNPLLISFINNQEDTVVPSGVWHELLMIKIQSRDNDPILIQSLTFDIIGANNGGRDLTNTYLTDDTGEQFLASGNIRDRKVSFYLRGNPLIISGYSTKIIKIYGSTPNPDVYVGLGLSQSDAIEATANPTAAFPLSGKVFRVINGANFTGQLNVEAITISDSTREIKAGARDQIITKFKLSETSGRQDILVNKIILTKQGDLSDQNLTQIDLVKDSTIIKTAASLENGRVIFDLSKQPLVIKKNRSETLAVRGDFVAGDNQKLQLIIDQPSDIILSNQEFGFRFLPTATFPVGNNSASFNQLMVKPSEGMVFASSQENSKDFVAGATNVRLGKFTIKSNGLKLNFNGLALKVINDSGSHGLIDDITIKHSQQTLARYPAIDFNNRQFNISFERDVEIGAQESYTFEIYGNIDPQADNSDTYQLAISNLRLETTDHQPYGQTWQMQSEVHGVKVSRASIAANENYSNLSLIAGMKKQMIGSFSLQVGAAEDLNLSGITLEDALNKQLASDRGYKTLYVAINRRIIGQLTDPLSSPQIITFKPYKLTKGQNYTLDIYADIGAEADGQQIQVKILDLNLIGRDSHANTHLQGLNSVAQLTTAKASHLNFEIKPLSVTNLIAGDKAQTIGSFVITNDSAEKISLKELHLYEAPAADEFSYNSGFRNLRLALADNHKKTVGRTISKPIIGGNKLGNFSLNPGQSITLDVLIDSTPSAANRTINLMIQDIIATGQTSKQSPQIDNNQLILGVVTFNNLE